MKKPNYLKLSKRTALALMNKVLPVTAKQLQGGEAAPRCLPVHRPSWVF